nr:hypothetical protein [Rickettsia asembonensis]
MDTVVKPRYDSEKY